jgi:hypothetical protein
MFDEIGPKEIAERINRLFVGKTPEQVCELMQALDLIVHMGVLSGVVEKKISGVCTGMYPLHCRMVTRMFAPRMILSNIIMSCPAMDIV